MAFKSLDRIPSDSLSMDEGGGSSIGSTLIAALRFPGSGNSGSENIAKMKGHVNSLILTLKVLTRNFRVETPCKLFF